MRPEERATPAQIISHEWVSGGGASKELLPHVRRLEHVRHPVQVPGDVFGVLAPLLVHQLLLATNDADAPRARRCRGGSLMDSHHC